MSKLLPVVIVVILGLVIFIVWPRGEPAPADGQSGASSASTPPRAPSLVGRAGPSRGAGAHAPGRPSTPRSPATPAPAPRPAPAPAPPAPTPSSENVAAARALVARADALRAAEKPVEARELLHQAIRTGLPEADLAAVRGRIHNINETLVFSKTIAAGDSGCVAYVVKRGDLLQRIAKQFDVDWRLLKRINNIIDERKIRPGWRIKVLRGPFHATVYKAAFRLEVHQNGRFVCEFPVGLGADDGTPVGRFAVCDKLVNPPWRNPRTGEQIRADDPTNPLGEHWIGLAGDEPATANLEGYGLHGTIEPQTIGKQASMGCVRMHGADVERLYGLLVVGKSTVTVRP